MMNKSVGLLTSWTMIKAPCTEIFIWKVNNYDSITGTLYLTAIIQFLQNCQTFDRHKLQRQRCRLSHCMSLSHNQSKYKTSTEVKMNAAKRKTVLKNSLPWDDSKWIWGNALHIALHYNHVPTKQQRTLQQKPTIHLNWIACIK